MRVAKGIAQDLSDGDSVGNFKVVNIGDWISGWKVETQRTIVKHVPTGTFYELLDSRTGSHFSEYEYESNHWPDEVELVEVKPVEKTITVYEKVH